MKTRLGVLLAMAVVVGAWIFHARHATDPPRVAAPTARAETAAPIAPVAHQPRSGYGEPRPPVPSPAVAEGHTARTLPLSTADVPVTPKLEEALRALYKTYGPGLTTWIDGKLARRAELAKCGISEPGAAKFAIRSLVDHNAGTHTVEELDDIETSYQGEMNDLVVACIRKAVVGKVEAHVSEVPSWFNDEQRRDWRDSPLEFEIDTVSFPIEDDELYQLFSEGRASAYQEANTKSRYGWE
jgi:hypothetical protein